MIGLLTKVNIVDNSGALEGRCIRVYGYKKDKGGIGDTILLTITDIAKGSGTIKRGDKYKAAIVRVKKGARAKNPFITRWDENAVVLIKGDLAAPIGSRIKGPISDFSGPLDKIFSISGPLRI